jgi:hypothetical protein
MTGRGNMKGEAMTKKQTAAAEPSTVEAAAATLESLKSQRAALGDRIEHNKRTSSQLSFAAFTDGGDARKRLNELNTIGLTLDRELANLDSAIEEATRRHLVAIRDDEGAAEREQAKEVADKYVRLIGLSKSYDELAAALVNQLVAIKATLDEITTAGCPYPGSRAGMLSLHRSLNSVVQEVAMAWNQNFEYRFLAPGERIDSFTDHCERWRQGPFKQWLAERVGEPPAVAAE